jgi:hypothetical protein
MCKSPQGQKQWGSAVTSRRALDAALVLDNLATHEARFLCDRDAMPACANVAQSVCLQVLYDMHTQTGTYFGECAQVSAQEDK